LRIDRTILNIKNAVDTTSYRTLHYTQNFKGGVWIFPEKVVLLLVTQGMIAYSLNVVGKIRD
jgi:hypothetical protein